MKKLLIPLLFFSLNINSQVVNTGTTANDGTGDPLKTAFDKVNTQFGLDSLKWRNDIDDSLQNIKAQIYPANHYVASWGSDTDPGDFYHPWATWQKAATSTLAGELTYIRGGTYRVTITQYYAMYLQNKAGTAGNMVKIWNYPNEKPVLNLDNVTAIGDMSGIMLDNADYIHLKGLTVTGMIQRNASYVNTGLYIFKGSDHNLIENCVFTDIEGYGFIEDNTGSSVCTDNLILNCDSYKNGDPLTSPAYNNGDGFSVIGPTETGTDALITFRNCRAWWNGDDGFDGNGSQATIVYENCQAFRNGYIPGTFTQSNANYGIGFKLGETSAETDTLRTLKNCLAFDNHMHGITTSDFDPSCTSVIYNCIAYRNKYGIWVSKSPGTIRNCVAYANTTDNEDIEDLTSDHNSWDADPSVTITNADFVSLDTTNVDIDRSALGELPVSDFLKLKSNSDLINVGVYVGINFYGTYPDLGPYENR